MRLLLPSHPLLSQPNAIGPDDFEGWVQERAIQLLDARITFGCFDRRSDLCCVFVRTARHCQRTHHQYAAEEFGISH